jgi:UDP:flavonoid glycosyltransferase YjiC (YdhE family)
MIRNRVVITSTGSRGDVQPFLALPKGLLRAGLDMTLSTHEVFKGFV